MQKKQVTPSKKNQESLTKTPTGIMGFDEITYGGLPNGRSALIIGGAGSGKTVFAMEFLARGATEFNEAGVFMSFEENEEDLAKNFNSLGFDIPGLIDKKMLVIDYIYLERKEIEEAGEFDLEGLFIRLKNAVNETGAKRVVLDSLEALFAGIENEGILRAELRRLFRWLKDNNLTAIITAEKGEESLTKYSLEEYLADCVIILDNRMNEQIATRRIRVLKYRGSMHGTNEYPFLINENGFSVIPITSTGLNHVVATEFVSTGIKKLDTMLNGKGYYKGSSILVTGTTGTGKTTFAAHFLESFCTKGKVCLLFSFEESPSQLIRNMRTVGIDLEPFVEKKLLFIHSTRPTFYGLEMHLVVMYDLINKIKPEAIVIDPISNLISAGTAPETSSMLTRMIDFLKQNHITSLFTVLKSSSISGENQAYVSSLMDTLIILKDVQSGTETRKFIQILKSRGMSHSNTVKNYSLTSKGLEIKG